MTTQSSYSDQKGLNLLQELEYILDSDPLIDEVGFIHPSQFVALDHNGDDDLLQSEGGIESSRRLQANFSETGKLRFWCRDHKLGISTEVLFPLYNAAKHLFMDVIRQYKILRNVYGEKDNMESDVMKHSRALLLLSCDFGTAWNSRKMVLSKEQDLSRFMDELHFSALVLSYSPKSEQAWSQRRWVIRMLAERCPNLQDIVEKESDLVRKITERYKMNYRAWNHRGWLVSYMTISQVLNELNKSRHWASLHVADNSCFHYRRRLLLKIFSSKEGPSPVPNCTAILYQVWKEELDWDEMLIRRYMGREALWLHRRFLSLFWIKHIAIELHGVLSHLEDNTAQNNDLAYFLDNEFQLLENCSNIPDSDFEDGKAQAELSASHFSWLCKQCAKSLPTEIQEKLKTRDLKTLLHKMCPDKSFLWDDLGFDEPSANCIGPVDEN
ncbi:Protein prenyltransferase, alpha subunit [Dillenia turbinata]|uniref:Protein prenyltransferase, alpha subunit n=1 Tax=Dillenia turbinata TaxID=194707 RepID=A0AAN8UIQ0_9MAGN